MEIGKRILALRKERKWTQQELAEKLFVTDKAVSKWEQGLGCPELSTIVEISKIFGVSTDYLLTGENFRFIREKTNDVGETVMKVGESIEARTHADFLNILLNKEYRGYMKCTFDFDSINLIWMIRLDNQLTKMGWRNSLESDGEKIIENYVGLPDDRIEYQKRHVYHQVRYVFDIVENAWGKRKYVFRGAFKFSREEGDNDYRVWVKISDTANFDELVGE
jgi:transcriptional regulator with XRE-family HTH domain